MSYLKANYQLKQTKTGVKTQQLSQSEIIREILRKVEGSIVHIHTDKLVYMGDES